MSRSTSCATSGSSSPTGRSRSRKCFVAPSRELVAGPTPAELADGLTSAVPADTELLDVNLADGVATVDLSSAYTTGGGSLSMMARVAQVVFTATQFDNADGVEFWIEGELDRVARRRRSRARRAAGPNGHRPVDLGSVIIDTPSFGATVAHTIHRDRRGRRVRSPVPDRGVVGRMGERTSIGGVAPVTAGAWGDWADFEVTITLDAAARPDRVRGLRRRRLWHRPRVPRRSSEPSSLSSSPTDGR